jgi:MYXO-CTERM domain-containing protein
MKSSSRLTRLIAGMLPAVLLATTAQAYQQPRTLPETTLETNKAVQNPTRLGRSVTLVAPATAAAAAFDQFVSRHGSWKAIWDQNTAVPLRLYGKGIAAPGAGADAAVAERSARAMLTEQIALVAPGASVSDFVVARNQLRAGIRTVTFAQRFGGLEVVGAEVSFTFSHDRLVVIGSTASPNLSVAVPSSQISNTTAARKATGWISGIYNSAPAVLETGDAVILPLDGKARVVVPVVVDQVSPRSQWSVYVDAATGEPVARKQRLFFGSGTVNYRVPVRYPAGGYANFPAQLTTHTVDGSSATSDIDGIVNWTGVASATVTPGLTGPFAAMTTVTQAPATGSLTLPNDGTALWDQSTSEFSNAQLTTYIHANIVKQFALRTLDADLPWLSQPIPLYVNETLETGGYQCNAFSNLDDLHFFVSDVVDIGEGNFFRCGNTGELADVVYHEFGHSLHANASGQGFGIDSALSEGTSDYLAATIVNDPDMGKGFNLDTIDTGLRNIDPEGVEYAWPQDQSFDPHQTGLIIAGALWDLRKALVLELGEDAGIALADDIYYGVISRSTDIPSTYVEALVSDDDDGDLSNGTPHQCTIDSAFSLHGLGASGSVLGLINAPALDGLSISLAKPELPTTGDCPVAGLDTVTATWRVRGEPATTGTVVLTEGADAFTGTLPADAVGKVLEFQVIATLEGGAQKSFPDNLADPYYQAYVGEVTEIYCTDFESDPVADGWTLTGFDWGSPESAADGSAAFSGSKVIGTVLAGEGTYQPGATYSALTQSIDTTGFSNVHLQLRRYLNTEDAVYDRDTITVNGTELWSNPDGGGGMYFFDQEWRFQDLDLSDVITDDTVQVAIGMTTDGSVEFGGWNVDDFCIVGTGTAPPADPVCGNGDVETGEQCDDGNTAAGDGCSATCTDEGEPPVTPEEGGCCSSSGGQGGSLLLGLATLGFVAVRRRRRRA